MDQEIAKVVRFAVCGLSNLLTTQIQVFMQMLQQRNSQLELLGKLKFNRNITLTYLQQKSKGIPRIVDFGKDRDATDLWWYRINTGELLQEDWCKNLRIDINTFMAIAEELRPANHRVKIHSVVIQLVLKRSPFERSGAKIWISLCHHFS